MLKFVRLLIAGLFNTLNASPTKWSNTLKQFVGKLPTNCLSVSEHFLGLALKGLSKYWPLTTIKFLHQTTPCRLQNDSKTKNITYVQKKSDLDGTEIALVMSIILLTFFVVGRSAYNSYKPAIRARHQISLLPINLNYLFFIYSEIIWFSDNFRRGKS